MTTEDKAKNSAQKATGKAKEVAGKLVGDEDLKSEGKADQTKSNVKQAGEHVKDVFKNH